MSEPNDSEVAVIVSSFARPHMIGEALRAITRQTHLSRKVMVVDNRSPRTAEIRAVVERFPEVEWVPLDRNTGFTGAMNHGISRVTSPFVCLTEDDMIMDDDCLSTFIRQAQSMKSPGILTGLIHNKGENVLCYAGGNVELGGVYRQAIFGAGQPDTGQFSVPFDVNYAAGAMMFARREVFAALGGFRPEYFMYYEDTELAFRAAKRGYRITVVPEAKAQHWPPSTGPVPLEIEYHKQKNVISLYLLHARLRVLPEFFARYVVKPILHSLLTNRPRAWALLRGTLHTVRRAVRLFRERGR